MKKVSLADREKKRKSFVNNIAENQQDDIKRSEEVKEKMLNRSYYITKKIDKALGLKAVESETDKSSIVRTALELYLQDIINKME